MADMTRSNGTDEKHVPERRAKERWHLRKEFQIGTVTTLALPIIGLIIWAAKLDQSVSEQKIAIGHLMTKVEANHDLSERMARIETNIEFIRERLPVIERKVDRIKD
jgi:hypothetical protein